MIRKSEETDKSSHKDVHAILKTDTDFGKRELYSSLIVYIWFCYINYFKRNLFVCKI